MILEVTKQTYPKKIEWNKMSDCFENNFTPVNLKTENQEITRKVYLT